MATLQDAKVELFYDGVWNTVAAQTELFSADEIRVTRGQGEEGAALRAASGMLAFNNATDKFRPSNPESPLYGKAGRNTPARLSVGTDILAVVEATEWRPDRTIDFDRAAGLGRAWVDLEAYGLLARIAQWTEPLRSPMYRLNSAYASSVGYFPMEDKRGVKELFSPVDGAHGGVLQAVNFESQERPPGSEPLIDVPDPGFMTGYFKAVASTTAGWQLSFAVKFPTRPVLGTFSEFFDWRLADGTIGALIFTDTNLQVITQLGDGTSVISSLVDVSDTDWTQWNLFRVKCTVSAGTVSVEVSWYTEGSAFIALFTPTYAGAVTSSLQIWGITGTAFSSGATYGHVLGVTGVTDDLNSADRTAAFLGYRGEKAADRFARLMIYKGLTWTVRGVAANTRPMGPERADTFLNLLKEIVTTEDGMIYDTRTVIGLTMRTRADRYNQTAAMALTFPTHITSPFREIIGDLGTHNRIIVSQRDGADVEMILTTGPMSVQPPPAGVGEAKQQVDVNVNDPDNDLPLLCGWWLKRGTLPRSRYASVTIDLVANPGLVAAASAVDIGDLLTVAGYEADLIPVIVIGITHVVGAITRKIMFTTVPGELFNPGVYGTSRYDSGSTTTAALYNSSATAITFSTVNPGDVWSTAGVPYPVTIAGEVVMVTAMGAVTGTGPFLQVGTVTRHINGVTKSLPAGSEIHVATPGRYAL